MDYQIRFITIYYEFTTASSRYGSCSSSSIACLTTMLPIFFVTSSSRRRREAEEAAAKREAVDAKLTKAMEIFAAISGAGAGAKEETEKANEAAEKASPPAS